MSVDKFGRHSGRKRQQSQKGPRGVGFNLTTSGDYDITGKRLQNVHSPVEDGDAVNLNFVKDKCLIQSTKNVYDASGCSIFNLKDPTNGSDAATKLYVDSKTPNKTKGFWGFSNKRLVNVAHPLDPNDAATLGFVKKNGMFLENTDGGFNAKNNVISNVAKPQHMDDVVSKRFLKEALADLSYALYSYLHRTDRVSIIHRDLWKAKVFESSWDELFM